MTMRLVHIISGLENGGAEGVLYRLISNDKPTNNHVVISLTSAGIYGARFEALGVQTYYIHMAVNFGLLGKIVKLWKILKNERPNVIQTWMYHGDLIGGVTARLAGFNNVCWGVRHSNLKSELNSKKTIAVAYLSALFSWVIPKYIISCSEEGRRCHIGIGYRRGGFVVVPNGFALMSEDAARPRGSKLISKARGAGNFVVGMVARWNPQKDHKTLFGALSQMKLAGGGKSFNLRCILIGPDMTTENTQLVKLISLYDLVDNVLLFGESDNVFECMNSLDLHVLSSCGGEGFPNVIGEAMLCATPCVVTDVGDAAIIVGDVGWVVPPNDPEKLAEAITFAKNDYLNRNGWRSRCELSKERIIGKYSIPVMVNGFNSVWVKALGGAAK